MDVRMPDGTVVKNVPEGITKAQLLEKYGKMSAYGPTKMAEVSNVPEGSAFREDPEFQAQEDPGVLSRLFNPPGGIGEMGPPPLTSEEGKAVIGALGATAGSVLAPQFTIPTLLARGSAAIGGAGLGGATGEMAADTVTGTQSNPAQDVLEYSAAETAGHGVGKFIGKAFEPLTKEASKAMQKAVKLFEFAKKNDVPISTGALIPGMTEKVLMGGADNFIPSRLVNHHYRTKLVTRLNELMGTIPESVGPVLGKEESSLITTEAFRAASNTKQAMAKRLRDDFLESVGPATVVPVKNTEALLKKISPQVKDAALREYIELELATVTKGTKSAGDLEQSLNQLSAVRAKGADKKYLTQIREAIQGDFKAVGADMEKLSNSNNFFSMNSDMLASRSARRLMKENLTSQQMTAEIFKSGNEDFVKQLGKELPAETWDSLKAQNLANQLENFSKDSDKLQGAKILDGEKLVRWIENNKPILKEAYDKETIEAFENLAQLAKAAKSDVAQFNKGGIDLTSMAGTGVLGSIKYADPVQLAGGSVGLGAVANELMRPNGILKLWLVKGFPKVQKGMDIGKVFLREKAPGVEQTVIGGSQLGVRSVAGGDE